MIENGYQWVLFIMLSLSPMDRPIVIEVPTTAKVCLDSEMRYREFKQAQQFQGFMSLAPSLVWCYKKKVKQPVSAPGKKDLERLP